MGLAKFPAEIELRLPLDEELSLDIEESLELNVWKADSGKFSRLPC